MKQFSVFFLFPKLPSWHAASRGLIRNFASDGRCHTIHPANGAQLSPDVNPRKRNGGPLNARLYHRDLQLCRGRDNCRFRAGKPVGCLDQILSGALLSNLQIPGFEPDHGQQKPVSRDGIFKRRRCRRRKRQGATTYRSLQKKNLELASHSCEHWQY